MELYSHPANFIISVGYLILDPKGLQDARVGVVHGCSVTGNAGFVAVLGSEDGGA